MQDILYLHTRVNSLTSDILAMRIVPNGQIEDGSEMELLAHTVTDKRLGY